jgi:hypothetical protein
MNERIRELESQCWEPRQYGPAWFDSEKFAELIVRECIEQVITGPNGPAHYAVEAALRLKKHFGVE